MVETPKLSSLAGDFLKFFLLSSVVLGLSITLVLFFLGGIEPYVALGLGFTISVVWVLFNLLWMKNKIEELFGRLMYVIDILEERHKEKMVVPIPIHEEVLGVVHSIKELVDSFEDKYEKNIRELEDQIEAISENASKVLKALEEAQEGNIGVDFPSGLDPVGAIGQSIQHVMETYKEKLLKLKVLSEECRRELDLLNSLLEENQDKIELIRVKEGIRRLIEKQKAIAEELSFFKDT